MTLARPMPAHDARRRAHCDALGADGRRGDCFRALKTSVATVDAQKSTISRMASAPRRRDGARWAPPEILAYWAIRAPARWRHNIGDDDTTTRRVIFARYMRKSALRCGADFGDERRRRDGAPAILAATRFAEMVRITVIILPRDAYFVMAQ